MRRCFSSLFFCMLAVSMGVVLLPDSQGQGSSDPSGTAAKKPSAKKPEASPKRQAAAAAPSCNGGELVSLHYLTDKDAKALGNALAGEFDWLRLSAVKDKNKICVIALPGDRLARANDLAAAKSVAVEFDRPVFSGQDGLAAYLVSLPRIGSERIARAFAESNPDLRLRPVPPFLVIVPKATPSDKIKEAAENLKHDFEGLDRIYPQGLPPALTGGANCAGNDLDVEGWLQRHTVLLSSLQVRDVVLRLEPPPTGFVFHAWPVSNRSALSIVPGAWTAHPCFAPGLALQQQLLFSQGEEQNAPKKNNQPTKNRSAGQDDAAAAGATSASQQAANKAGQARLAKSKTPPGAPKAPADKTKKADESKKKDASDSADSKPDTADDPPVDTAANDAPAKANSMGEFVRLYHFRQAGDLATILNDSNGVQVKAVGSNPDVLLISGGTPDDRDSMRRLIASLDLPRPQLSLQVWSYQASSKEKDDAKRAGAVQDAFKELRSQVDVVNNAITASLDKGVAALASSEQDQDQDFRTYLISRYKDCVGQDRYCLGFYDALVQPNQSKDAKASDARASLTRLLLLLAAVKDDLSSNAVNNVIKAMEFPASPKSPTDRCADKTKKRGTQEKADSSQPQDTSLDFCNLKAQLDLLAEKGNLHAFRTAILNFLFIYKQHIIYRREFVPYDLQKAAHDLDSLMGPVLDAFNQDVDPYIDDELHSLKIDKRNAQGFVSSSSLQVAAISGTQAVVSGKVNNYFDITPPLSLADLLKGPDQNVKDALAKVLQPKEIMVVTALANLTGQPRITAEVGRGASLTITPVSLDGASSAALDVDFNVSEGSAPQSTESTPRKDLLDRVAEHKVTSHVRVESLKLFSVSSFTMELQHPERGQPFPIIGQAWEAVFGQTPYLGRLFHFPNRLATVDNRSAAIVRAVVVPTAMDLGLGLPFEQDRVFDPAENATINLHSMDQMEEKPRLFHRDLMLCIEKAQSSNCLGELKLSTTPADLK